MGLHIGYKCKCQQNLVIAKQGGAIPNNPDEYALKGEKGEYRGNDTVNLIDDNVFITVPVGSTPVS